MQRNRYYQIINWLGIVVVLGITGLLFFHLNQVTGYAGNDFLNRFVYTSEWPSRHTQEINSFMKWCHSLILFIHLNGQVGTPKKLIVL